MVIDARNLAKWIKYNTCAQSTLGGQICFCPRISVLKKLMFEIEQFVGFEYSTIRSCTITLYFLQDRISFDYLRFPPRKFNHPRKRLSCLSPRNGCRIVSTIYRETNRFPPLDFSPVINSSLDINEEKRENRYDGGRRDDGGTDFVSFDELRSQTNHF